MRRWPAEWEPHEATLFAWPWDARIWGAAHESVKSAIAAAAAVVSRGEGVTIVVDARSTDSVELRFAQAGGDLGRLRIIQASTDDVWIRDSGPSIVRHGGERVAVDWNFTAWGRKHPHANDALLATKLAPTLAAKHEQSSLTTEGGAVETNGRGTLLTTRSVLLNPNRNSGMGTWEAEEELLRRTGAERVVWLEGGMATDDTDGHIDTLARFVSSSRVFVQTLPASQGALDARNRDALLSAGLELVELPATGVDGLPASYANLYFANAAVLVPAYGTRADATAHAVIAEHVDRAVVPIDCRGLITQGGAIHCATQQIPL